MSLETGIPDGEYELELSEVVQNYIQVAQDSRIKPIQRLNDEILSIRYGFRPESLDDTKSVELIRDDNPARSGAAFQLRSQSTEDDQGITFEGASIQPKDLECILLFNPYRKRFELQKLDSQLRTHSIKNRTTTNNKKPQDSQQSESNTTASTSNPPPKRKPAKEPSIFQPKPRAKTPLPKPVANSTGRSTTPNSTKSSARQTSVGLSDDEVPLSKLGTSPIKKSNLSTTSVKRSATASPSLSYKKPESSSSQVSPPKKASTKTAPKRPSPSPSLSPEKRPKPKTSSSLNNTTTLANAVATSSSIKPITTSSPNNKTSRTTTPQPRSNSNTLKPFPNQVSSKKPPSTISTPTIQHESPSDDDEFGSLVDELEEELLSDDNFITIEDGSSKETTMNESKYDLGFKSNGNGPINFRNLAGMSSKDEDELSSSEEE